MKLFNTQTGEYKEIQLNEEEETFLNKISDDYNICYNDGYIEIYEPEDINFTKRIRKKLDKLGYENSFSMVHGTEYYYRYVDE
jgi:hypothetical protein